MGFFGRLHLEGAHEEDLTGEHAVCASGWEAEAAASGEEGKEQRTSADLTSSPWYPLLWGSSPTFSMHDSWGAASCPDS